MSCVCRERAAQRDGTGILFGPSPPVPCIAKFNAVVMERCTRSGVLKAVQDIVAKLLERQTVPAGEAAAATTTALTPLTSPSKQPSHSTASAGNHSHQLQAPRQRTAAAAAVAAAAGRSRGPHHHGQQQQGAVGQKRPSADGALGSDASQAEHGPKKPRAD